VPGVLSPPFLKGDLGGLLSGYLIPPAGQVQSDNAQEAFEEAIGKIIKGKRNPKRQTS
jgi:hypothetical protein